MDWLTFFSKMIWPGTLFIILIYFRNEIGLIIKRIKTAQIGSYKAEFGSQEQEIVKKSLEEVEETIRSNSPIIYESQISIESEMLKNLGGDDMAVNEHCRKNFTFILLSYSFFKVYLNIFGTQIELLYYLNSIHQVNKDNLYQFYSRGKEQYPEIYQNINFELYLSFLISNKLIQETNGAYSITPLGKDFVKFLGFEKLPGRIY